MKRWFISCSALLLCGIAGSGLATGPTIWRAAGSAAFSGGEFDGVALAADGRLVLAPEITEVRDTGEARIWALAAAPSGALYVAAGEGGTVTDDTGRVLFHSDGPAVQALAYGPGQTLAVATGPHGSLYRVPVTHDGAPLDPWFDPEATYVWDMLFTDNGDLVVATGDPGKILRVHPDGTADTLYDGPDQHVRVLALDAEGRLIAGTSGQGHVFRVEPAGGRFVLYDSPLPEIADLVWLGRSLIVAAVGTGADGGTAPSSSPSGSNDSPTKSSHGERGAVYRIEPDGTTEQIWSSAKAGAYSLAAYQGSVLVGTGQKGRVLLIDADGGVTRVGNLDAEQVVAMAPSVGGSVLAVTSNPGRVLRFERRRRSRGEYRSEVLDTGAMSRWGTLRWRAVEGHNRGVGVFVRVGNTSAADDTWTDWIGPVGSGSSVDAPAARYAQWKVVLEATEQGSAGLERVELSYVTRNLPPRIDKFQVHPPGVVYRQTGSFEDTMPFAQLPQPVQRALQAMSKDGSGSAAGGRTFLGRPFYLPGQQTFSWEASDPNGDDLAYRLEFRGEDESEFKPLSATQTETMFSFDTTRLPDGVYWIRLVASDEPSNAPDQVRSVVHVGGDFVVDNTPPGLRDLQAQVKGRTARITGRAIDATSLIRRLQVSVDASDWRTIVPEDGFADGPEEGIDVTIPVDPGEHVIVVRAQDTALNTGSGKVVVRVP